MKQRVPLGRAMVGIIGSLLVVLIATAIGSVYYRTIQTRRLADPTYQLFSLVQTGPEKDALPSACLAELLQLSTDKPINLYAFDCAAARRRLLGLPIIKAASIKTFLPGTVYVDYSVRKPVAYLRDYSNTALDGEGVLIPFDPFFTPKKIPEIYLGLPHLERVWGTQIKDSKLDLASELAKVDHVQLVDVSQADSRSFGQRQIVLKLEERFESDQRMCLQPVTLRLNPDDVQQALADYQILRNRLRSQALDRMGESQDRVVVLPEMIVDMRLPDLAQVLIN